MTSKPVKASDLGVSVGQVFLGKYRVDAVIGQGGMGIVCACTHLKLNEKVAIKMLRPDVLLDQDALERFQREAQAAVKLKSEYVAHVSDVGVFENDVPFMVMEYLDGHDLAHHLDEAGAIPVTWAVDLMLQAAEALAEAHSIGIIHRDVKPTNLFLTWRPDGSSLVKVLDFGISKSRTGVDMQLTQTQSLLGTPAYMSPEQMRSAREVDPRTDIWSLGTVLYEIIEGRRPFEADSFSEMCVKVACDAPLAMKKTPPALQKVVLHCLAKMPHERYANMAEVGRDLIPFAKNPHHATMLVERMERLLRRSVPDAVPYPMMIDTASQPAARPALADSRATPRDTLTGADGGLTREVRPKRRTWLRVLVISIVGIAAGIAGGVVIAYTTDDGPTAAATPPAKQTSPPPAPEPPPAAPAGSANVAAKQPAEPPKIATPEAGSGSAESTPKPADRSQQAKAKHGGSKPAVKGEGKSPGPDAKAVTGEVPPVASDAKTVKVETKDTKDPGAAKDATDDKAKPPCDIYKDPYACTRNK